MLDYVKYDVLPEIMTSEIKDELRFYGIIMQMYTERFQRIRSNELLIRNNLIENECNLPLYDLFEIGKVKPNRDIFLRDAGIKDEDLLFNDIESYRKESPSYDVLSDVYIFTRYLNDHINNRNGVVTRDIRLPSINKNIAPSMPIVSTFPSLKSITTELDNEPNTYKDSMVLRILKIGNIALCGGFATCILMNHELHDLDFFFYGINEDKAKEKILEISELFPAMSIKIRSTNCITFIDNNRLYYQFICAYIRM